MLLKKLTITRPDLKIILMSATLNTEIFSTYFNHAPIIHIEGRMYPVNTMFLENILDILDDDLFILGYGTKNGEQIRLNNEDLVRSKHESQFISYVEEKIADEKLTLPQLIARYSKNSLSTWKNLYLMDYERINNSLIVRIIEWIIFGNHHYPKDGSILV